jgi:hypothetical protein
LTEKETFILHFKAQDKELPSTLNLLHKVCVANYKSIVVRVDSDVDIELVIEIHHVFAIFVRMLNETKQSHFE